MRITQLDQLDSPSIEHILRFLSWKERKASARISRYFKEHPHLMSIRWNIEPLLKKDPEVYRALENIIVQDNPTLEILEKDQKQQISLKPLAKGCFKIVFQIKEGRALVLPWLSIKYNNTDLASDLWERMVLEEIRISKVLRARGLLTGSYERVDVVMFQSSNRVVPAYKTETFEELSKRGIFIIDKRDGSNSIWKKGQCFLFNSTEERRCEKNWDSVVGSLLTDIVKLFAYNLPLWGDSVHTAIVRNSSSQGVSPFEIRYFGYDFSMGNRKIEFAPMQGKLARQDRIDISSISYVLDIILWQVFRHEFVQESHETWVKELVPFGERLIQKYSSEILSRI